MLNEFNLGNTPKKETEITSTSNEYISNRQLCIIDSCNYQDMLNILPPVDFTHHGNYETFMMSEMTDGSITSMYILLKGDVAEQLSKNLDYSGVINAFCIDVDMYDESTYIDLVQIEKMLLDGTNVKDYRVVDNLEDEYNYIIKSLIQNKDLTYDTNLDEDELYNKIINDDYIYIESEVVVGYSLSSQSDNEILGMSYARHIGIEDELDIISQEYPYLANYLSLDYGQIGRDVELENCCYTLGNGDFVIIQY